MNQDPLFAHHPKTSVDGSTTPTPTASTPNLIPQAANPSKVRPLFQRFVTSYEPAHPLRETPKKREAPKRAQRNTTSSQQQERQESHGLRKMAPKRRERGPLPTSNPCSQNSMARSVLFLAYQILVTDCHQQRPNDMLVELSH